MNIRILGCGSSGGVPVIGDVWGDCDSQNPKNYRTRSSIMIEQDNYRLLIDATPDLRVQFLQGNVKSIDAVFITHVHADHITGLSELNVLYRRERRMIPCYAMPDTMDALQGPFGFAFKGAKDYSPFLKGVTLQPGKCQFGPFEATIFPQKHGAELSYGLRFGSMAYTTDLNEFYPEYEEYLFGLDVWIIGCLEPHGPHPTHATLDLVLRWAERFGPRQIILTHMGPKMDYEMLQRTLPPHIIPAFDGMVLDLI